MEKIESRLGHSVAQWEKSIKSRQDISFEEMSLYKGMVCGVTGYVLIDQLTVKAKWFWDGRCFIGGKRARQFDIKF